MVYGNKTAESQSAQRTTDLGGVRERRGLSGSVNSVAVNFSGRSIRAVVTAPATEVARHLGSLDQRHAAPGRLFHGFDARRSRFYVQDLPAQPHIGSF